MTETALNVANMIDMLPEKEQSLAFELIKRLVLAWDPDYTKLTPQEADRLNAAKERGEYFDIDKVDWDNV